jgi:TatD DNase family protein
MSDYFLAITLFSDIIKNMLEKSLKNFTFCDAHFHLLDFPSVPEKWMGCTCAHSIKEWETQKEFFKDKTCGVLSFGLHPQSAEYIDIKENADYLEHLLKDPASGIKAIGEAGFDYFTEEFKNTAELQEEIFNIQLDLALKYNIPIVIHCRKANHKLFEYSKQLKKLPEILFHSFMGPPVEAKTLLERGINGYFSFGKQLFNGNKKVIACVKELPPERILSETDAPFQYLKGEKYTDLKEIKRVYEEIIYYIKP